MKEWRGRGKNRRGMGCVFVCVLCVGTLLISHYSSHGATTYCCITPHNVTGRRCVSEEFVKCHGWMYVRECRYL